MHDSFHSNASDETSGAFESPYRWDASNQLGLPTLRDQLAITAASEFAFWQPNPDWLISLVEATMARIQSR